jgi:hypothetical protein
MKIGWYFTAYTTLPMASGVPFTSQPILSMILSTLFMIPSVLLAV